MHVIVIIMNDEKLIKQTFSLYITKWTLDLTQPHKIDSMRTQPYKTDSMR